MIDRQEAPRTLFGHFAGKAVLCAVCAAVGLFAVEGVGLLAEMNVPFVNLSERQTRPPAPPAREGQHGKLRFAVATMVSAESTFSTYQRLVERVAAMVGREPVFVLRSSYAEVRRSLERGQTDVAFVCTGTYVHAQAAGKIKLLVQPQFALGRQYRSLLIVPADSEAESLDQLRGASMAFTDPESNTGCLVPTAALAQRGSDPHSFFRRVDYTGSHDRSIQAVALGVVDAAAVDSLVYESLVSRDPSLGDRVKAIWQSDAFGPPPIVVPRGLDAQLEARLRAAFLEFHNDPEGHRILSAIGISRFTPAREEDYESAVRLGRWLASGESGR